MTYEWNSEQFDLGDRTDALRTTVRDNLVDVDLELPSDAADVDCRIRVSMFGNVQVSTVDAMPTVVHRRAHKARDDSEPSLFVTVQLHDQSLLMQHGREIVLKAGDIAVYATTSPYTLAFEGRLGAHFFRFPLQSVGLTMDQINAISAVDLAQRTTLAPFTWNFFKNFAQSDVSENDAFLLGGPTTDLLRNTLSSALSPGSISTVDGRTLTAQVKRYVLDHLSDPTLDAKQAAAAHHVSVRHLYATLSTSGVHFSTYLRAQRLARIRSALADPTFAHLGIATIAGRNGFVSPSHFSREFRREYGLTAREWRELNISAWHAGTASYPSEPPDLVQ